MSRIGKLPVTLIAGVTAEISKDSITVKGAKGTLSFPIYDGVSIVQDGDTLKIEIANTEDAQQKAFWGLTRACVANMVKGVSEGYIKSLEIV